jgi:hypothetical protein
MGAVVACSTPEGIKIAVADNWAGAFIARQDLYVLIKPVEGPLGFVSFFNNPSPDAMADYATVKFTPSPRQSPFGLVNGITAGGETVWVDDYSCGPVVLSARGETFDIVVTATMDYDLDGNGIPDYYRHVFEKTGSFYIANGKNLVRPSCGIRQIEWEDSFSPWIVYQKTGTDKYTSHQSSYLYMFSGGEKIVGTTIDVANQTAANILFSDIVTASIPVTLRNILINTVNDGSCEPMGSYAFEGTFLHAVNATTFVFSSAETGSDAYDYYQDHPEENKWRLFYSMTVGTSVYNINSDQFIDLLDSLSALTIIGNWRNAMRMLSQLTNAFPNNDFTVPYDSRMFHAHDGNIYTWTRSYGAVKFTTTGLFAATVIVPDQVTNEEGVRPDITYIGTFEEVPLYLCVSNKVKVGVRAVHYGSPFTGWSELPGSTDELISVRPIMVKPGQIFLLGVVKYTVEEVSKYSLASLSWAPGSVEQWRRMGELPFTVGDNDNFSIGLFGDDQMVKEFGDLPTPPIVPQSPVGPYDKYAIGMP